MEFTLCPDPATLSAIFNSHLSSTSRVATWLLALQPYGFIVTHIKGEENEVADKLARIAWAVAKPIAVEIIQHAGELEFDRNAEEECDSDIDEEEEERIQDDSLGQGEVVLLGIKMLREDQKGDTD